MDEKIGRDYERFKIIVRGKVREELQKHIAQGGLVGKQGNNTIKVPIPVIDMPHFRHGNPDSGVGQGDGEEGDIISSQPKKGKDSGKAGDQAGEHMLEVDMSIEELADLLGEQLKLPMIEPKGKKNIMEEHHKYTGIRNTGPESLRHNKRTFKQALKREISMGNYNPDNPIIIPVREDKRYRARKTFKTEKANAVIFYIMDVSGSMGIEQKDTVRIESFWIDTWLRKNYDGIESRYIIHDAEAKEVDRHTFFNISASGGTRISSAYELLDNIVSKDYNSYDWNLYAFQFSDGDNISADDNLKCCEMLEEKILPLMNLFGYGQVESTYGTGEYLSEIGKLKTQYKNLALSKIKDRNSIVKSIQDFFGKKE